MSDYTITSAPLTWLDVERRLKKASQFYRKLPPGIAAVRCFSDATEIDFLTTKQDAQAWLRSVFQQFLSPDGESVELGINRTLHRFEFEQVGAAPEKLASPAPLWDQQAYLDDVEQNYPAAWQDGPVLAAFHSFKGGVGRTTALMAFAAAFVKSHAAGPKKLLLIDGDFEAPGISFWLDAKNHPSVSFVQLLEAVHYPPTDVAASLEFFAAQLRKTSLEISAEREIFILPSALDLTEIMDARAARALGAQL